MKIPYSHTITNKFE